MGILEVVAGPQERLRAVEHVRHLASHVPVFKRFMGALGSCVNVVREQTRGELEIEGLFHPTERNDVIRLELQVLKRSVRGRILHACDCHICFRFNEQGLLCEILSSTILPQRKGNHDV